MSKTKIITIEIEEKIKVTPVDIYKATVVKSGNGAVIKSFKKFLGKDVVVILAEKVKIKTGKEAE